MDSEIAYLPRNLLGQSTSYQGTNTKTKRGKASDDTLIFTPSLNNNKFENLGEEGYVRC